MRSAFVLAVVVFLAAQAEAGPIVVVTFTGLRENAGRGYLWTENGVSVGPVRNDFYDAPHLDGWPGIDNYTKWADITTGSRFDAISIDINPGGVSYTSRCSESPGGRPTDCDVPPSEIQEEPIPYIGFSGFRDGSLVAEVILYRPAEGGFETISLEEFVSIDRLRVSALTFRDLGLSGACLQLWCSHFLFDNVTLRLIPEPPGYLLLVAGLTIVRIARRSFQIA